MWSTVCTTSILIYCSVPGKRPWALKRNSRFWPAWALTQDQNPIRLYRSCYIDPLKCGTWALTWEWALARDTTVHAAIRYSLSSKNFYKPLLQHLISSLDTASPWQSPSLPLLPLTRCRNSLRNGIYDP